MVNTAAESSLSHVVLRVNVRYDKRTGLFTRIKTGEPTGRLDKSRGYVRVRVNGHEYAAHRLAWFYVTGKWPTYQIDHRDGVKHNNRFSNLRDCPSTAYQNQNQKMHKTNTSGHPNVRPIRKGWRVQIEMGKDRRYQSPMFFDFDAACAHAREMKAKLHGFQPVHRIAFS